MIPTPANATVWRIYTEAHANLPRLVSSAFNGATLIPAIGLFRGLRKSATVIEILTLDSDIHAPVRIANLAESVRQANSQQSVLVTRHPTFMVELVETPATPLPVVQ